MSTEDRLQQRTRALQAQEGRVARCTGCGAWTLPRPGQEPRDACTTPGCAR